MLKLEYVYRVYEEDTDKYDLGRIIEGDSNYDLPGNEKVTNWKPFVYEIKFGEFPDLVPVINNFRLCSEKLKKIIDGCTSTEDGLQWLDTYVIKGDEKVKYYILHFCKVYDIANLENSKLTRKGDIIVPAFNKNACDKLNIFTLSGWLNAWFVKENVKKEIEKNKCTNIEFTKRKLV